MKNNTKKIIILSVLLLFLLTITTVSATDNNNDTKKITTHTTPDTTTQNTEQISTTKENNIKKVQTKENIKKAEDNAYTVTVSNSQELKDEIENAKNTRYDNYTINYQKGEFDSDYVQDVYDLVWGNSKGTKTLILDGNGITFIGQNTNHFINVTSGYTLILKNTTLTNFHSSESGGAITSNGNLIIRDSKFNNNHASGSGGVIYNYNGNTTVYNSLFNSNNASYNGGAIYGGNIRIFESSFYNNTAKNYGGAIIAEDLKINDSTFISNEANNNGGAINTQTLLIDNSTFYNNHLDYTGYIGTRYRYGGAVYCTNQANISNAVFDNNFIIGMELTGTYDNKYYSSNSKYNKTFRDYSHGGAIYTTNSISILNCTFKDNFCNGYVSNHSFIDYSTISWTKYTYGNYGYGYGGAIYSNESITINKSKFKLNMARYGAGGAILAKNIITNNSIFENNTVPSGNAGAIFAQMGISISNSKFENNSYYYSGSIFGNNTWSSITVKNSEFNNNGAYAIQVPYVTIYNSNFNNNNVTGSSSLSLYNSTFNTNITVTSNMTNPHVGDNISLTVTLKNPNDEFIEDKDVIVKVGQEVYNLKTNYDGEASLSYTIPNSGDVPVSISCFEAYYNSTYNTFIYLARENSLLSVNDINTVSLDDNVIVNGLLRGEHDDTGLSNQNIIILVNNVRYVTQTDENGSYNFSVPASILGINNITVLFEGNNAYYPSNISTTFEVIVKKNPNLFINPVNDFTYFDESYISGRVVGSDESIINCGEIAISLNDNTVTVSLDENGEFREVITNHIIGPNTATVTFSGNDYYDSVSESVTFNVNKQGTFLTVDSIDYTMINDNTFTVPIVGYLTDVKNNPLDNQIININIDNKNYNTTTNNGLFNKTIIINEIGDYSISITYSGNEYYSDTNLNSFVNITEKIKTEITIIAKEITDVNEELPIVILLKDNQDNPLTGESLDVSITDEESTTLQTDNSGMAYLTITPEIVGEKTILVSFTGNKKYNKTTNFKVILVTDGKEIIDNTNYTKLLEEITRLNNTINNLIENNTQLKEENSQLNQTIIRQNNTINDINIAITNLTTMIQDLSNTFNTLNNTLTEQNNMIQKLNENLTQQNKQLNNTINEQKNIIQELNGTINNLIVNNTQLKEENNQLNQTINNLNNTIIQQNNTINNFNNTLTQENNQLKQTINTLNNTINNQENTINQQNNKIQELNNTINQLIQNNTQQANTINQQNNKIQELNNTINQLIQNNTQQANTINQLNNTINNFNNTLTQENNQLKQTINTLNNTINNQENTINNLNNRITTLNDTINEVKENNIQLTAENNQLTQTINKLNNTVNQQKTTIQDQNQTITSLKNTNNNLNNLLNEQKEINNQLNNIIQGYDNTINTLTEENLAYATQVNQLNNEKTRLENELLLKEQRITNLTNNINELYNDKTKLRNQVTELTKQSLEKDNIIQEYQKSNNQLSNINTQLENQIQQQLNEIKTKNQTINTLNNNVNSLNSNIKQLNNTVQSQKNTINQLTTDNNNKQNTINTLNNNLNNQIKENNNKQNTINAQSNTIKQQETTINKQNNTITQLNNENKIKDNTIKNQEKQIKSLQDQINNAKLSTTISVEPITATIGQPIKLTSNIKDQNGNNVESGRVSFKANNIALKDSNNNVIYAYVDKGKAVLNYTVPTTWIKNTTIQANYLGDSRYTNSQASQTKINITKGKAKLTLEEETINSRPGENITIHTKITDSQGNRINTGKVLFKLNDVTLKDGAGKAIILDVKDGEAILKYHIPETMSGKNYKLSATYTSDYYNKTSTRGVLKLEKLGVTINTNSVTTTNGKTTIKATIKDSYDKLLIKNTKLAIKINGKTVLTGVESSKGQINITFNNALTKGMYELVIISGENGLYKTGRMTTVLTIS